MLKNKWFWLLSFFSFLDVEIPVWISPRVVGTNLCRLFLQTIRGMLACFRLHVARLKNSHFDYSPYLECHLALDDHQIAVRFLIRMQSKRISTEIISQKRWTPECFEDLRILAITFEDELLQKILQTFTDFDYSKTTKPFAVESNHQTGLRIQI